MLYVVANDECYVKWEEREQHVKLHMGFVQQINVKHRKFP